MLSGGYIFGGTNPPMQTIQRGTIAIAGGSSSNTASITSVDTTRSVVVFLGFSTDNNANGGDGFGRLTLTNATTVTANRGNTNNNCTVSFEVWQFSSGILSLAPQVFSIAIADTTASNTATITSITTTTSIVVPQGWSYDTAAATNVSNLLGRASLTNATTVTATRGGTANGLTLKGAVLSFAA